MPKNGRLPYRVGYAMIHILRGRHGGVKLYSLDQGRGLNHESRNPGLFSSLSLASCRLSAREGTGKVYYFYSLDCLEEEFSEIGFPAYGVLGNSYSSGTTGQNIVAATVVLRRE